MALRPELELAWFGAALDDLPDFLLSNDTLRRLSHPPPGTTHDLSLGGLILAGDMLRATEGELSPSDRSRWSRLQARWEEERGRRAAAVERKAAAELPMRLNLWRSYLSDLGENPRDARDYSVEIRNRVIIERLAEVLGDRRGGAAVPISRLDEVLHRWFAPGPFIWPEVLRHAYPEDRYWYLHGGPERSRITAHPGKL